MQSTLLTCVRTHCRTSLVHTTVLHSYMRHVCRHYRWLHSYMLLVCRQHHRPAFVCIAKPCCYTLLSYIGTCCSSDDYIVDLRSYALQNLVGTHGCPTFVHATPLPPLPLATFVHTPRLPSTPSTCVRTHCRTSLVHTAVVHSYTRHVCHHYHWLHSYAQLLCRQHRRPAFVRIAKPRCYPLLSYICTCCSSAVYIVDLCPYALQKLVGTHCFPTFVRSACMQSTPLTCVRMGCRTSLVHTAVLHSYTLHVCRHYRWLHSYVLLICRQHRRPVFVRVAKPRCYPLLSYIRMCYSSADYIVDLRSYALQNLVGTHGCPTFVHAARLLPLPLATFIRAPRLPSTSSTCVRTRCRTSSVCTAVLHSYMLRICRHYRWLHSYVLLVCRQHRRPAFVHVAEPLWYTPLPYIRTHCTSATITAGYLRTYCSSAVYIVDLHSYALQKLVGTHCCPTFVRAAHMKSSPLICVRTHCRTSLVHTAVLHSYTLHVCRHYRGQHSYALLVCRQHRRPAFVRIAKPRCYPLLSYIGTCCSSTDYIVDLRSYALQNLVGMHGCPTFVHAARLPPLPLARFVLAPRLPSTSLTCIHTRCRTSLVHTAVIPSYTQHL